jgi:hypothetical protein
MEFLVGTEVRPTFDVDVIAEITSYADYATFSVRLRALGFREDTCPSPKFKMRLK